jgi:hypothetical protein
MSINALSQEFLKTQVILKKTKAFSAIDFAGISFYITRSKIVQCI